MSPSSADLLRSHYLSKREKNPHYSLRSFARDLGVSHTFLSLVFSGKRKLTPSQTVQIGMLLGLDSNEIHHWTQTAIISSSTKRGVNQKLKSKTTEDFNNKKPAYHELQLDTLQTMGNWTSFAILEATYLKDATNDPKWYAKKLNINPIEATESIQRLIKLGILLDDGIKFKKTNNFVRIISKQSNSVTRAFIQGTIHQALEELKRNNEEDFQARWMTGGTLAIKSSKVARAREKLKRFQEEFIQEFAETDGDDVYLMNMQFFPAGQRSDGEAS